MEREEKRLSARRGLTVAAAVIGVIGLAALGCSTFEPVLYPQSHCAGYGGFGYWFEAEPNHFTLCTDGSVPVTIQFKDAEGHPVDGGGTGSAPGCATYWWPPNAAFADWFEMPRDGDGGEELLVMAPPPGSPGAAVVTGFLPAGAQEYVFGCTTLKAAATDVARTYEVAAMATSLAEAQALVNPLIYHGAGGNVPEGVEVHFDIEAELVGLAVEIRSSLHGRFDDFRVDVEGQTVADLGSGLNVQVTHPGGRWTTVVATIPLSQLSNDTDVTVSQQANGDPSPLVLSVDF